MLCTNCCIYDVSKYIIKISQITGLFRKEFVAVAASTPLLSVCPLASPKSFLLLPQALPYQSL